MGRDEGVERWGMAGGVGSGKGKDMGGKIRIVSIMVAGVSWHTTLMTREFPHCKATQRAGNGSPPSCCVYTEIPPCLVDYHLLNTLSQSIRNHCSLWARP